MPGRFKDLLTGSGDLDSGFRDGLNDNFKVADLALDTEQQVRGAADSNLQTQISKEVQDRVAAVQGHISAIAAHAAAAITLSPVTGLNANNLQTAVEQLRAILTTVIAGPNSSAEEVKAARVGADNIARSSLDILIKEIHAQQLAANTATAQLKHGQNVVNASEAGPVAVTVKGNTLVNLLGNIGNFEVDSNNDGVADGWFVSPNWEARNVSSVWSHTGSKAQYLKSSVAWAHINYPFVPDPSKFYIFRACFNIIASVPTLTFQIGDNTTIKEIPATSGVSTHFGKFRGNDPAFSATYPAVRIKKGTGSSEFYVDSAALYEVSAEEYNKINVDPEWSGDKLAERYPYVDGVKHASNPVITKIGKNLLPPFFQWTMEGGSYNFIGPYELEVIATDWHAGPFILIDSLPQTKYTLCFGEMAGVAYSISSRDSSNVSTPVIADSTQAVVTFTTPANSARILIKIKNRYQTGTFNFANLQLELGSTATIFEPRNNDYCYTLTTLAGYGGVNDVLTIRGTEATVLRKWKTDMVLDGSFSWNHYTSTIAAGRKSVVAPKTNFPLAWQDAGECTLVSPAGIPLSNMKLFTSLNAANQMSMGPSSLTVTIANADSGWGDDFNPSSAEVRAYFWGWKMNNGTFGQPYNGSGTKTWTRWDATSNTGAVTTVPTVMADGYTPYKLSYQLANPVTEVVPIEGSLANHAGINVYEVGEGVIVREKVVPYLSSGKYYIIGNVETRKDPAWGAARTLFSASKLLQVYKNREKNSVWVFSAANNASIDPVNVDTTAEYTVTYIVLDKYAITAPVVEGSLDYQTSSKSVQQALVQRTADAETAITIHDRILAQHTARLLALEA